VVSTRWQVVGVQPAAEVQHVIIAFRDTVCQLDGVEYAYPETHLAAASVTVEGDVVQIHELGPWRSTNPGA